MFNALLIFGVFLLSLWFVNCLRKRALLDTPNQRSSHDTPTPTGGGLGMISALCMGLSIYHLFFSYDFEGVIVTTLIAIFMIVGFMDDRIHLSAKFRFLIQIALVGVYTILLAPYFSFLHSFLPEWFVMGVLFLGFIWFINLYNFMDGIDGITSLQSLWILLGLLLFGHIDPAILYIVAAAVLGFTFWNIPPAKIFMGDSGSIPLGFLMGYFLIENAHFSAESLMISFILPLYYIMDASLTLARRISKGKKPWEAHREHFYQQKTTSDKKTHKTALITISSCNAGLLIWASLVPFISFFAILGAFITVFFCLNKLKA